MSAFQNVNFLRDEAKLSGLSQTCCLCDDGGKLIECCKCGLACCFELEGKEPSEKTGLVEHESGPSDDEDSNPCITLPATFDVSVREFWCPLCLEQNPSRAIDYAVNRGSRATQRRVISSEVVIIVNYLPSLEQECRQAVSVILSVLGAFHISTTAYWSPLPTYLSKGDISQLSKLEIRFHLVFMLFTESNPGGGWWHGDGQDAEASMLNGFLSAYDKIASRALSAQIFVVACGLNLPGLGVINEIEKEIENRPWHSLVLPAAASVLPSEYVSILPQVFTHIYYLGTPLTNALLRVWAARKPAGYHTDLVVFDRPADNGRMSITKYTYGTAQGRPWGLMLPLPGSLCVCARSANQVKWKPQGNPNQEQFGERFLRYRSSCGHVFLGIAVCLSGTTTMRVAGVQVVKQPFDREIMGFPLDSRDWFHFEAYKVLDPGKRLRFREHSEPWTACGRALLSSSHSSIQYKPQ